MPFITGQWFNNSQLYEYNPATNTWDLFSPQPTGDPFGFVATRALFGQYDGDFWRHNGQGGTSAQFWRLESGVWVGPYDEPFVASNQGPPNYCESVDGLHRYAILGQTVQKFNGTSWDHTTLPGVAYTGSIWCDTTGQYVYATPGNSAQTLFYSDDYGATWTNIYSSLPRSDVGVFQAFGFGTGASHTCYIGTNHLAFGIEGWIYAGNGASPWVEVAYSPTHVLSGTLWGYNPDNLFVIGNDGTGGSRPWGHVLRRNGSSMNVVLVPSDGRIDAAGVRQIWGVDETEILCCFQKRFLSFEGQSYRSTDGGTTWVQIDTSAVGDTLYMPIAYQGVHLPPGYSTPPYLQNQNPAPGSTGNGAESDIYLEVVDNEGDVDTSTVDIYVNAVLAWTGDSVVQPGYSGYKVPVANGYAYVISPWENFDPGTQSVRVVADDLLSNSLDDTYTFDTVAEAGICIKVQWGDFQWGAAQWGQCVDFEVTAVAINEYTIRVFFGVVPGSDSLIPNNYTLSGGFRQLTVLNVSTFNSTTVDLTVLEMTNGAQYTIEFLFAPFLTETATFTGLGIPPFVTSVQNSQNGILVVQFSETMLNDENFGRASSYIITPQGNAKLLFVNSVSVDREDTSQSVLSFSGGGSFYILSTPGLMDLAGNYCDPPDFLFEILNPEIDELLSPERLFLDTDMGPMALGYSELSRRRVEDLAILRARNEGHLRQFSLIADELDRSGIDRDDRKLKLFKG